ncbi:MAG: hypothetical protein ACHP7J_00055 [Terriglobales bacterium]
MAVAQKAGKTPLAGQPGYDPNTAPTSPDQVVQDDSIREVQAVRPRARAERTADSVGKAKKASGKELIAYLVEFGTNPEKLKHVREWLLDNDEATAEQCYHYLEECEFAGLPPTNIGTLRKACKWIWGEDQEPASVAAQLPGEDLSKARTRISELEREIAQKNAELVSTRAQLAFASDKNKELGSMNDYFKKRASAEDIGPGKNVLEGAVGPV